MNILEEIEAGVHDDVLHELKMAISDRQSTVNTYDDKREAIIDEINCLGVNVVHGDGLQEYKFYLDNTTMRRIMEHS